MEICKHYLYKKALSKGVYDWCSRCGAIRCNNDGNFNHKWERPSKEKPKQLNKIKPV